MAAKFKMGMLVSTPNALDSLNQQDIQTSIGRHMSGDWGELDAHDRAENEYALTRRLRLFSVYEDRKGIKFWIITEADRSVTTVLLPEDY